MMVMQTKVFAKRGLQNDNTNQGLDFKGHILCGNIFLSLHYQKHIDDSRVI